MSAQAGGGRYQLVQQDDRFDGTLRATKALLRDVAAARGPEDVLPAMTAGHNVFFAHEYRPYAACAHEYLKVMQSGAGSSALTTSNGIVEFQLPMAKTHMLTDACVRVRIAAIGTQTPTASSLKYRYVAYPGVRLFQLSEFVSGGVAVDRVTPDDVAHLLKNTLPMYKLPGFQRCVGQQTEQIGQAYSGNEFTSLNSYANGPQTAKYYQPALEMFIPLWFFFNSDPAAALLSTLVPSTQCIYRFRLATLAQMLRAYTYDQVGDTLTETALPIQGLQMTMELYQGSLMLPEKVFAALSSATRFSLIRVHEHMLKTLNAASDRIQLAQLKYPVEELMLGIRAIANADDPDYWVLMGGYTAPAFNRAPAFSVTRYNDVLVPPALQPIEKFTTPVGGLGPLVDTLGLVAHDISIRPELATNFYSSYIPLRYVNNVQTTTPTDPNECLVPFNLLPFARDPSGQLHLSSDREVFLVYTSSVISATAHAELSVSAVAVNFLYRSPTSDQVSLLFPV
jgi:hypothetical protein